MLGMWVVTGWNEILTETAAKERLSALLIQWTTQDENTLLKKAAGQVLDSLSKGAG
jgi:hypothetical protein